MPAAFWVYGQLGVGKSLSWNKEHPGEGGNLLPDLRLPSVEREGAGAATLPNWPQLQHKCFLGKLSHLFCPSFSPNLSLPILHRVLHILLVFSSARSNSTKSFRKASFCTEDLGLFFFFILTLSCTVRNEPIKPTKALVSSPCDIDIVFTFLR